VGGGSKNCRPSNAHLVPTENSLSIVCALVMESIRFAHSDAKAFIADRVCDAIRAACTDRNMVVLPLPAKPMVGCSKFVIAVPLSSGMAESIAATLHLTMLKEGAIKVYGPDVSFVSPDDAADTVCIVTYYIPSVEEAKKEVMTNPMGLFNAAFTGRIDTITAVPPSRSPILMREHVANEPQLIVAAIMVLAQRFHQRSLSIMCHTLTITPSANGDTVTIDLRGWSC